MTTAHRPTWAPAKGGEDQGGFKSYAGTRMTRAKDLQVEGKLKLRAALEASPADDMRAALEARERKAAREARAAVFDEERERDVQLLDGGGGGAGALAVPLVGHAADADDASDVGSASSDSGDDSDDDEAALLAELARIKAERAAAAATARAAADADGEAGLRAEGLGGNPLMAAGAAGASGGGEFEVRRGFGDDTVFRNAARSEPDARARGAYVNDTLRSSFHRRFLDKYMR